MIYLPTHVPRPFRRYAGVHVKNGEDCRHLQIHDAAAHQTDHEKDGTGHFEHFNLAVVEHVGGEGDREEDTKHRDGEHGNSVNGKLIFFGFGRFRLLIVVCAHLKGQL